MQIVDQNQILLELSIKNPASDQICDVIGTGVFMAVNEKTIVAEFETGEFIEQSWLATFWPTDDHRVVALNQFY